MPVEITEAKLNGEVTSAEVEKGMLALKWVDKRPVRPVNMLSTIHDDFRMTNCRKSRFAPGGVEDIEKPPMVKYNTYMGNVDKGDQLMSYYGFDHRTVK